MKFREEDVVVKLVAPPCGGMQTGQIRNGVFAIHTPSCISVGYTKERSAHRNKAGAMRLLRVLVEMTSEEKPDAR